MKRKAALVSLFFLLFLSAFSYNPRPAGSSVSRPLFALPLPEGRTLDEGHDSGFIDWSGSVGYINLNHKDGICPSGCVEQVTRIHDSGAVSGTFAPVDVSYFEVMVAFTHNSGAGTAVLNACGSSAAWNLYAGPGSGLPGFVSMLLSVPSGCTSWSLSAAGGYVDFRSVDANYVSPPPPVSTNTFTPIPTETFTPSLTATETPIPTTTFAPTLTATDTLTPTATETLAPGVTPSNTPTLTETPLPPLTSTPSQTLPPGVTPSDTAVPTDTPVLPVWTNTPKPPPSGGGQGGNPPVIPFTALPTATQTRSVAAVFPTTIVIQTVTSVPASTATPRPIVPLPASELACTPSPGSDFPWWLLPAGLTLASAFSLLGTLVKNLNLDTASLQVGDFSISPFGVTLRVPRLVPRVTTIGEWVTRPIRTLVQITRTIWRTITEAVPRFITRARQIVEQIVHSEWVTTFRQVAKTFWETVTEKVPLLGLFGKFLGFIWKTFVKPVIRWVTEAIRTLRTWVETIVRTIVEKIQDGWNYITRQVSETVRDWVEKTDWVREWVTKEITVWETVWEKKFYPFPMSLGGGGAKIAVPAQQTWSRVLMRKANLTISLAALTAATSLCPRLPTPTPTCTPTPAPNVTMTNAVGTQFANLMTQTAMVGTPTPVPTATLAPFVLPSTTYIVGPNETDCQAIAAKNGISLSQLYEANPTIKSNDPNVCYIREGLVLTIPEHPIRAPGENVALYKCENVPPKVCISPTDTADMMLTHILFGEGGSTIGPSAAANEMYVLTNRANQILRQRGIDPFSLTDEQYKQFLIQVASQTYYDNAGNAYPAFNAFDAPVEHPDNPSDPGYSNWKSAEAIVSSIIANRGQSVSSNMKDVIAYCAPDPSSNFLSETVYYENVDIGNGYYQYYFTYHQFYNAGGKEFCEKYANYK